MRNRDDDDAPDEADEAGRLAAYREENRRLTGRLEALAPAARAAVAAAVADRLLPVFLRFHRETGLGDPSVLERSLDDAWNRVLRGSDIRVESMVACFDQARIAIDHPEPVGQNAVYAVWAAVTACRAAVHDQVLDVLHTLRYGRECAVAVVIARDGRPVGSASARAADRDPLVRDEIRRQLADLAHLESAVPTSEVLAALRTPRPAAPSGADGGIRTGRDDVPGPAAGGG